MSQLGGAAADDPRIGLLTQLLEQRMTPAEPAPTDAGMQAAADHPYAEPGRAVQEERERARRLRELNDTVRKVYAELKALRERNDALAAALGACFLCFGADPLCEECGGLGAPGSRAPEPAAYREYVLPALLRIRKIQSMRNAQGVETSRSSAGQRPVASAMPRPGMPRVWRDR